MDVPHGQRSGAVGPRVLCEVRVPPNGICRNRQVSQNSRSLFPPTRDHLYVFHLLEFLGSLMEYCIGVLGPGCSTRSWTVGASLEECRVTPSIVSIPSTRRSPVTVEL